jgi:hypothetical protein
MAIYEVSDNSHGIALNRADRLGTIRLGMSRERVEVLVPLHVDEFAGRRPAVGDAPQRGSACAARSSP